MAPRKKTTPAVDTEVSAKAVETVAAEPATEKKTPAKKATTTKKTAASKNTSTTAKKTTSATRTRTTKKSAAEPAAPVVESPAIETSAPKAEVFIEYGGVQVSVDEIISNAKKIVGNDKDIKIYVQPNTSKAYIAFGEETVSMDVFFC